MEILRTSPFSLSALLIGPRSFPSMESRTRARILVNVVALTFPMPVVDAVHVLTYTDSFPLFSAIAAVVLPAVLLWIRLGRSVAAAGLSYAFAMEFAFIEAAALLGSHVAMVGLFFIPFLSVLTLGRARAAPLLVLPAVFFLASSSLQSLIGFSAWRSIDHIEGYRQSEILSSLISLVLVYLAGCALESLSLNIYRAYLREQAAVRREIAARTTKETELADSLRLLGSVFDAIPVPVFIKGTDSRYLRCSAAFYEFMGYGREAIDGKSAEEFLPPAEASLFHDADRRVMESGRLLFYPATVTRASGEAREVSILKTPHRAADGAVVGVVGVILDQTDTLSRERRLESLLEANRGALALVGHDLRNPIGSFRDLVRSIRSDECIDPEEYRTVLSEMEKSLDAIWRLLDELLDWARTEGGLSNFEPEETPLLRLVESAAETVAAQSRSKSVPVSLRVPEGLSAWADSRMLSTILRNLMSNAVKFTPRGGSVAVSAERVAGPSGAPGGIRLSVSDTGVGMPPSVLRSMMETGAAGQRRGTEGEPGTGLGLGLCRRLVDRHGGTLEIESVEGQGSTFKVFLPFRKSL